MDKKLFDWALEMRAGFNDIPEVQIGKNITVKSDDFEMGAVLYEKKGEEKKPVIFDLHGGGYIYGTAAGDDVFSSYLSDKLDAVVISLDYPLSPEHRFPFALEKVYGIIKYILKNSEKYGIDPNKAVICGHSAGGNLAAALCLYIAEKGENLFCCQALCYPWLDLARIVPDSEKYISEVTLPLDMLYDMGKCYCEEEEFKNPLCTPLYADDALLSKVPPAIIFSCEDDCLRDEPERYAEKLFKAGVEVTMRRLKSAEHGVTIFDIPMHEESKEYIASNLKKYI